MVSTARLIKPPQGTSLYARESLCKMVARMRPSHSGYALVRRICMSAFGRKRCRSIHGRLWPGSKAVHVFHDVMPISPVRASSSSPSSPSSSPLEGLSRHTSQLRSEHALDPGGTRSRQRGQADSIQTALNPESTYEASMSLAESGPG